MTEDLIDVSRIAVRPGQVEGSCEITVSDTGRGMNPALLPHVFEPFRQAEGAGSMRHKGLGLGLSIVRHIVEMHGGTVVAESPGEGQGTTFRVRLPLHGSLIRDEQRVPEKTGNALPGPGDVYPGCLTVSC